jgi:predicted protein tyrosine phosphatase
MDWAIKGKKAQWSPVFTFCRRTFSHFIMISEIHFISYVQMIDLRGDPSSVVISISDVLYEAQIPIGFHDVLRLNFADIDPSIDGEHARDDLFNATQANHVKSWTLQHEKAPKVLKLIVHCWAGISRSAAIAWWAHQTLSAPILTDYPSYHLNRHVLACLDSSIKPPPMPHNAETRNYLIHHNSRKAPYKALSD